MDRKQTSLKIKDIFNKHGFLKTGIAKPHILEKEKIFLQEWLKKGYNADMEWINKSLDKRLNPFLILPDLKSIIVSLYIYDTPFEHSNKGNIPKISKYAWGKTDYHKVLKKKLKNISKEIISIIPDTKIKFYVDDGPIMEKVWASYAGIGWIGKNTLVIEPEIGSFFFLAVMLLNIKLDFDEPINDMCGGCNICVNACPTGAIYEEYKLDSNLCISYHTIENKKEIPDFINTENWIFGCDVCQDVCPYNKRKFFTEDKVFYPNMNIYEKDLDFLTNIDYETFEKEFKGSPLKRIKYKGWLRNINHIKNKRAI